MPRFDTCVHCIVLKDASADIDPHPELRNPRPGARGTSYDCNTCGTQWTYHAKNGWKFEGTASRGYSP